MVDQEIIKEKTRLAFAHHQAGRLQEAEDAYSQILQMDPDNANVLNLLGLLFFNSDRREEGINCLIRAVEIFPCAYFYKNLGIFYIKLSETDKAIDCFEKAIGYKPEEVNLYRELAELYRKNNNPDSYIDCYKKLIEIEPDKSSNYLNIAEAYLKKNDFTQSVKYYEKAMELKPCFVGSHIELVQALINNKQFDEAVNILNELIETKPDLPEAYYYLGQALFERYKLNFNNELKMESNKKTFDRSSDQLTNVSDLEKIVGYFQKTIELNPDQAGVYVDLGNVFFEMSKVNEAIVCFERAIELDPNYIDAYYNLGIMYKTVSSPDLSIKYYKKALSLNPDDSSALLNLGNILSHFNRFDEALKCYQKILDTSPNDSDACVNIGVLFMKIDMCDKAQEYFHKALEMGHNKEEVYLYMGTSYYYQGKIEESINYYNKIMEIDPEHIRAQYNLGKSLLINGDFDKGWELYELRLLNIAAMSKDILLKRMPRSKKWRGESIDGKTVYVCFEQGYGDALQFSRFVKELNNMGAHVIFEVPIQLEQLFKQSELNAEIINFAVPEEQIEYDYYVSIMSLPYMLKINSSNVPYSEGYLKANKEKVNDYKEKYFDNDYFKIGIAWQGNPFGLTNRIVPLNNFFNLAKIPDVKVYSLQKGDGIEEMLNNLPGGINITDLGKTFKSFDDTAAAIENLDLVIVSDTSVAHLAGGLGKQTWLLLPSVPEWRWMLDREDTPWYKSFKLFRQKEKGNWPEVMDRVIMNLNDILSEILNDNDE